MHIEIASETGRPPFVVKLDGHDIADALTAVSVHIPAPDVDGPLGATVTLTVMPSRLDIDLPEPLVRAIVQSEGTPS